MKKISNKISIISGSTRKKSTSELLSNGIRNSLTNQGFIVDIITCFDIPLFSEDLEGDKKPSSIINIEKKISESTGVIICTPEYNSSIPGSTKNLLDWLSRPHDLGALRNKIISIVVHTPFEKGGGGAYSDLSRILSHMGNVVLHDRMGRVSGFRKKDGEIVKSWQESLDLLIDNYIKFIHRLNVGE
ncbi:NAD(P)H-dependent oxidoreductase [Rosenbergiella sp. S61]|uniref:NAD(P)H-dependent oxidoreductase n=1 Tax=Rosenbergiella gaditana TaxID=2726987 RepID=A0ABS5T021_9GAMM|nr:NAD(P)H-dependent oxidoreductase [Rosenbergiella gaditana]MBT0725704.1 NAD(P)H-dependent oxidoreductase [Rosenbergiella gaditana]